MGPQKALPIRVKEKLGVLIMKEYFTLHRSPKVEPHNQMLISFLPRISLLDGRGYTLKIFYDPTDRVGIIERTRSNFRLEKIISE